MECHLCCEKRASHRFIHCPYCSFECCHFCLKQMLTTYPFICPAQSCKRTWNLAVFLIYCPRNFINRDYKTWFIKYHLQSTEMNRIEEVKLELRQEEEQKAYRKMRNKKIKWERKLGTLLDKTPYTLLSEFIPLNTEAQIILRVAFKRFKPKILPPLSEQIQIAQSISKLTSKIAQFEALDRIYFEPSNSHSKLPSKKDSVKFHCPLPQCDGLVVHGICSSCEKAFCALCKEVRTEGHTCNAEAVTQIKRLAKCIKNCPTCVIPIERVSGCNTMWCVNCKSFFDWSTLKPLLGRHHNPHYTEWIESAQPTCIDGDVSNRLLAKFEQGAIGEKFYQARLELSRIYDNVRHFIQRNTNEFQDERWNRIRYLHARKWLRSRRTEADTQIWMNDIWKFIKYRECVSLTRGIVIEFYNMFTDILLAQSDAKEYSVESVILLHERCLEIAPQLRNIMCNSWINYLFPINVITHYH